MKKIGIFLLLPIFSGIPCIFSCNSEVSIWKRLSGFTGFGRITYIFTALSSQIFWFELYPSRCTIPRGVSFLFPWRRESIIVNLQLPPPSRMLRINPSGHLIFAQLEFHTLWMLLRAFRCHLMILLKRINFYVS